MSSPPKNSTDASRRSHDDEALRFATELFDAIDTVLEESSSCPTLNFGTMSSRSSLAWNDAPEPRVMLLQDDAPYSTTTSKHKPQRLRKTRSFSETDLDRLRIDAQSRPPVLLGVEEIANNESTHSFRGEFDAQSV